MILVKTSLSVCNPVMHIQKTRFFIQMNPVKTIDKFLQFFDRSPAIICFRFSLRIPPWICFPRITDCLFQVIFWIADLWVLLWKNTSISIKTHLSILPLPSQTLCVLPFTAMRSLIARISAETSGYDHGCCQYGCTSRFIGCFLILFHFFYPHFLFFPCHSTSFSCLPLFSSLLLSQLLVCTIPSSTQAPSALTKFPSGVCVFWYKRPLIPSDFSWK